LDVTALPDPGALGLAAKLNPSLYTWVWQPRQTQDFNIFFKKITFEQKLYL
jgi:hypothetical protein